ncbi:class II fumarate hydratase [Zooshikella harenae]|uniref:Fumarate hydratase class II n=1 Tax=Zooshikella harenae TaxID=2827238 RepID=A0ABS5ZFW4_9GAMM|nr:class II fumarate hydratase [Zooshikella harenae]MBU2712904.1 class II fumarate hydratase [Zooshikella harenae]
MKDKFRTVSDSMGNLEVPVDALYGAQTQRAIDNFKISGLTFSSHFIVALAQIKHAAAEANQSLGLLPASIAEAICKSATEIIRGEHHDQFPIDIFQTGSGTSTNMNMNEVLATLASREQENTVHANDHVNMGQSSNDVIPTAIHISSAQRIANQLLPALTHLHQRLAQRASEHMDTVKTGRTHLMDAMPVTLGQELTGWAQQINDCRNRIRAVLPRLHTIALGGTAVGTGINTHSAFATEAMGRLSVLADLDLTMAPSFFTLISTQDTAVELSGQLKTLAVALLKISNDLRWMNSGPQAGLGEITLAALQPGSSIMPGKVNPVIPEAVMMAAAQVVGNDATITLAGQSGNFQLNVMLPVIAFNLLQSIELLSNSVNALADQAIATFKVNQTTINQPLYRNPILVTALNPIIGYEKAATIAKQAYQQDRPVLDVALEYTSLSKEHLEQLLDPFKLTQGGLEHE